MKKAAFKEGNGALELLDELGVMDPTQLLGMLWEHGYKVVPLEAADLDPKKVEAQYFAH